MTALHVNRQHRALLALAVALLAPALTACGLQSSPSSGPGSRPMTPRALAAATIDHLGEDASAAAPLAPRDGVPADAVGVEVAFPRDGETTHVRVVVSPGARAFREVSCDGPRASALAGCQEEEVDGVPTVLAWEAGYPEEDPGRVSAAARHDGWVVTAVLSGPFVQRALDGQVGDQADALVALVADPDVGPSTSAAYATAGEEIGDDVWLDWYGQGNGIPAPKVYSSSDG